MATNLEYLYGLERFGVKPGLSVMERMMELLGHPERGFKSIHVTGTNGKGSTCAMLESVLRESGKKTGLYTSPHLHTFHERIRINGVPITDNELSELTQEIRSAVEADGIQPTFFEFTTALAFLYFARSKVDIAVIEVGMGGRYDATNVITPLVSVITNIGLDHMEFLGSTKAEIAFEKAGIIKEGMPAVTCESDPEMLAIFDKEAIQKHAKVLRVRDVVSTNLVSLDTDGQVVDVTMGSESFTVHLPLLGAHQVHNMATAIAALTVLPDQPSRENIVSGIGKTVWGGRLEVLSKDPLVIVDGAHNQDGAKALADFLKSVKSYDVLVYAAKKGKDISDMLELVIPLFSHVIVTKGSFIPEDPQVIAGKIRGVHKNVHIEEDVSKAVALGKSLVPVHGTLLITGSLYMIGDALAVLKHKEI